MAMLSVNILFIKLKIIVFCKYLEKYADKKIPKSLLF